MLKSTIRVAPRRVLPSRTLSAQDFGRRFLSWSPPVTKPRTWKGSALRWGLAGAAIYYYNTSNVFAEEPDAAIQRLDDSIQNIQESKIQTIDAIVEKRRRQAERVAEEVKKALEEKAAATVAVGTDTSNEEDGMEGLEGEASQQGAFNEETGEINWDCPCLGGMAHGPCGEEFKTAFSCFVYSKEEPKGMDCIENFKGMQDCFRAHPEIYADELEDDEDEVEAELRAREAADRKGDASDSQKASTATQHENAKQNTPSSESKPTAGSEPADATKPVKEQPHRDSRSVTLEHARKQGSEDEELLPKAVHDAK